MELRAYKHDSDLWSEMEKGFWFTAQQNLEGLRVQYSEVVLFLGCKSKLGGQQKRLGWMNGTLAETNGYIYIYTYTTRFLRNNSDHRFNKGPVLLLLSTV